MQDGTDHIERGSQAIHWLTQRSAADPNMKLDIRWDEPPVGEDGIQGILDILFGSAQQVEG